MVGITAPVTVAMHYRIGGMDCPSCASKIETALIRLGGTDGVRVNYQTQTVTLCLDEAVPAPRGGEIQAALQIAVAMHLAGNHEMPGTPNIADEYGFSADESRSRRIAFEEPPFLFAHGGLLPYSGPAVV